MYKPLSLFIGLRYTRAKRRNHFISFIAMTSMIGIGLGVAILITVMSVMNGFERELKDRILGMAPHAVVQSLFKSGIENWQKVVEQATLHEHVLGAAPFVSTQGMLKSAGRNVPAIVQGIAPDHQNQVSILAEHIIQGSINDLKKGEFNIILGRALASRLGVFVGDKVTLMVAEGATTSLAGVIPRFKRFTVSGLFEVGAEMDGNLAVINMSDAALLLRMGEQVTGVRLKVDDLFKSYEIAQQVANSLGGAYSVSDWTRSHGNLFQAVKMEKTVMFIILLFIIAVAAFNIVSSLVMVVTDKQSDIAILKTLGVSRRGIVSIFFVQGAVNGVVGTVVGTVLGVFLASNVSQVVVFIEQTLQMQFLDPNVYFIGFLPSELHFDDVINISCSALLMSLIATIYPALRAGSVQPAEALRYE